MSKALIFIGTEFFRCSFVVFGRAVAVVTNVKGVTSDKLLVFFASYGRCEGLQKLKIKTVFVLKKNGLLSCNQCSFAFSLKCHCIWAYGNGV